MNWEIISVASQVVASVAVLATLVYLSIQIRQNTRSARSDTAFSVNQALSELNSRWVNNENGFTEIWLRGCADIAALNPVEMERFSRHTFDILNLAVFVDKMDENNLGDVHMDFVGYAAVLFQSNPGLLEFFIRVEPVFVETASQKLFDRISGRVLPIKHSA